MENSVGTRAHPQKNLREVVEKPRVDFMGTIVEVRVNPGGFIGDPVESVGDHWEPVGESRGNC